MTAAILTVGTELTRGEIADTNAAWLASRLVAMGFDVGEIASVPDEGARIVEALRRLAGEYRVVLVSGGLGPTTDDLTAAAAATAAGVELVRDEAVVEAIRRRFQAAGRVPGASNAKQADVPRGAEVLGNPVGTAPAFRVAIGAADVYFLPGVPEEMEHIFDELLARRIAPLARSNAYQVVLRTYGLAESAAGEKLVGLAESFPGVTVGYRVVFPEVEVKLLARAADVSSAKALAERAAGEARARLGDCVFGTEGESFAAAVGRGLRARGFTLAVAESCTGGLIGSLLTAVPGSSDYLLLDAVTYSNAAKERVLEVPSEVLRGHGAVSPECARAMAEGARRLTGADLAVAVTGVAGPGGGTPEKPVGLVYLALSRAEGAGGTTVVVEKRIPGDRARVQRGAAYVALALVRDACRGPVPSPAPVCG